MNKKFPKKLIIFFIIVILIGGTAYFTHHSSIKRGLDDAIMQYFDAIQNRDCEKIVRLSDSEQFIKAYSKERGRTEEKYIETMTTYLSEHIYTEGNKIYVRNPQIVKKEYITDKAMLKEIKEEGLGYEDVKKWCLVTVSYEVIKRNSTDWENETTCFTCKLVGNKWYVFPKGSYIGLQ